jgi:lipopolysaccharide export LptBFGC system permease protein LptF
MLEKSTKKKQLAGLFLSFLIFIVTINSLFKAVDKGETWRIIITLIPAIIFLTLSIIILKKYYNIK